MKTAASYPPTITTKDNWGRPILHYGDIPLLPPGINLEHPHNYGTDPEVPPTSICCSY